MLRAEIAPSDSAVCPTSSTMRNFEGTHFPATVFDGFDASGSETMAVGLRAASLTLRCFEAAACLCAALALAREETESVMPTASSNTAAADALIIRQDRDMRLAPLKRSKRTYSAAAMRGRPTKPAASPNRSTITAGNSFNLCVTQAPERTA